MEIRKVFDFLGKYDSISIVDVGCHKAHFIDTCVPFYKKFKNVFTIGIDPINYNVKQKYSYYAEKAIDNVEREETVSFFEYVEPGCNSLLEMKMDKITHTKNQPGWYVPWEIERLTNVRKVTVDNLKNIIKDIIPTELIHLLKIDTQGKDIDVIKSLGDWKEKLVFVQIESVSTHDKDNTLYHKQSIMEDDISYMNSIGFDLFDIEDFSGDGSPEANLIFKNRTY